MTLGHLPAGYLLTRAILRGRPSRSLLLAGLVASLLPDVDMLYALIGEQRNVSHHTYFTHLPAFWLLVWFLSILLYWLSRALFKKSVRLTQGLWAAAVVIVPNILLHLLCDTVAANIKWLWPFSDEKFHLVTVSDWYTPHMLNYVLHWTFGIELLLLLVALWVWKKMRITALQRPVE